MIHPNSVAYSLFTTLSSDATLVNSNFNIDFHEVWNTDSAKAPWIGVYLDGIEIDPHHTQINAPWMATYNLQVFVQEHSFESGEKAMDRLHRAMTPVFTAINSNRTLDGTVNHIIGMEIVPFERNFSDEDWMFTDILDIFAEVFA